jgi:phage terminase large subunit-like protein
MSASPRARKSFAVEVDGLAAADPHSRIAIEGAIKNPAAIKREIERGWAERRLIEFYRQAWPQFDPAPLSLNWHHHCIAEHLEAVTKGEIKRLLVNLPPRASKTSLISVCWPAWTWVQKNISFLSGPQVRFLCVSYGQTPVQRMASTTRQILMGKWYQDLWGKRVEITKEGVGMIENSAGGYRISDSLSGAILGSGGDIIIADDPHSVVEVESDTERANTLRLFTEGLTTRRTVPHKTAIVVVMQRLHENDISGHILENDQEYVHVMVPMRFEPRRFIPSVWFSDPRTEDGELMWPDHFLEETVDRDQKKMGEYAFAAQYQQSPVPRGGGIIKRAWWRLWPDDAPDMAESATLWACGGCKWAGPINVMFGIACPRCGGMVEERVIYPPFSFQLLSVDTSYGEKEENSWSAATAWGIWHGKDEAPRAMLTTAWRGRPKLRTDPEDPREPGLVERIYTIAQRRQVDLILIEKKTRGVDLYQEIERQTATWPFRLEYWDPTGRGDKVARLHSVSPLFENDLVWAPDKQWAEVVIQEIAAQPKAQFNDLSDTCTAALIWLRQSGMLNMADEHRREVVRERVAASAKRFDASEAFEGA